MSPKPLHIHNGTLEALKWVCIVLMTLDHINTYIYNGKLPHAFEAARVVMPIFCFILAYNLSRETALENGVHIRVIKRLAIFGLLATPAWIALSSLEWISNPPLNVLFTLLVSTAVIYFIDINTAIYRYIAFAVFVFCSTFTEYWWFGVLVCVSARYYCKKPNMLTLSLLAVAIALLGLVNGNMWACAAIPILLLSSKTKISLPRNKTIFYIFYPLHLTAIALYIRSS